MSANSAESLFTEKEVTLADALEHGLTEEEYAEIRKHLYGRVPTVTELGVYSALWSEHCSYKNSILQLKTLPTESARTLTKTGEENAGALDIGQGLAVVFKIESHNHPSAIEPYQGAATGVGGIMRDIFTMGARPIASLNSLRFGPPTDARNRYLLARAVKGIGDYGNSLGIAVSGGELLFDESFSRNCLVNAMTVGIVKHDGMMRARAEGVGNSVFIVGATTGRDGIHGASFASRDLSAESESKRSAVQVGDPFMEKLLLEATLELAGSGAVVGIQDMGAAGLSCASSEMSAKGDVGMDIDLDRVPLRETGMNAYEIMLSESQERMLVVVSRGREVDVQRIFQKWRLHAVEIGSVAAGGRLRIRHNGRLCADIPAESLVLGGGAPRYLRKQTRPSYLDELAAFDPLTLPDTDDISAAFLRLVGGNNTCSRRPLFEQYDTEVGLVRLIGPGGDGGVSRVPGTKLGIATSVDCNSRYVYLDPRGGTRQAVFEAARNVAVTGAVPLGVTNCLNFGNPYVPDNYFVFAEAIAGMGEACRALDIPVTGGNVSFYNESQDGPVLPTPTIGMVGLIDDITGTVPRQFAEPGLTLLLVGRFNVSLGGSEFLYSEHKKKAGRIPELDVGSELALIRFLVLGAKERLFEAAGDLSLGGLAMALYRTARGGRLPGGGGFSLDTAAIAGLRQESGAGARNDLFWFGETNSCALICVRANRVADVKSVAEAAGSAVSHAVPLAVRVLGRTAAHGLDFGEWQADVAAADERYEDGLVPIFGRPT